MQLFVKVVNGIKLLAIFTKNSIFDVSQRTENMPLDYKTFDQDKFVNELKLKLNNSIVIYDNFEKLFV